MKVGLLLEGGAMRGMYTVGALDCLMKNNIKVDGIIGVSAGALFGINYKSKQPGRALRYNLKYCKKKNYMGFYSLITTGDIMNKKFCFDKLIHELDPIDYDTFKNSPEDFFAVVTNMETGKAEYIKVDDLTKQEQVEALRASGSMPFVSKPVEINGNKYLDGGTADSIPIDKIMELGYDKIIVILTRTAGYRKEKGNTTLAKLKYKKYPNFIKTIEDRYLMYNEELDKISKLEKDNKIFVVRPSRKVNIKRIEKNSKIIQEMYDLGVEDMEKSIEKLKEYIS